MSFSANGHGGVHAYPERPDRLPEGKAGTVPAKKTKPRLEPTGRPIGTERARELSALAHRAKRSNALRGELLRMRQLPSDHPFYTYAELAREFRESHTRTLAQTVGGGVVGPAPASLIAHAAYQLAMSRWIMDEGTEQGDVARAHLGSRIADASRQNLLAAHELCAREAVARHKMGQERTEVGSLLTQGARVEGQGQTQAPEEGDSDGDG